MDENGRVHCVMEVEMDDEKMARMKAEDTDGDGTVTLYLTYRVVPYTEDDNELYLGGVHGTMRFQLPLTPAPTDDASR